MSSLATLNRNPNNMLKGANRLNLEIKNYMDEGSIYREELEEFKESIEEYLEDIPPHEFGPGQGSLTKEGVIADLNTNLTRINNWLQTNGISGGKKRKNRKSKRRSKKRRGTKKRRGKRI